ncbi:hypothetical protein EBR43_09805 [bacterium]|nr:hypothetical protein [bacterium]
MKNKNYITWLAALLIVAVTNICNADSVLFDFGRHDNTNGMTVTGAISPSGVVVGSATAIGDTTSYVWNSVGATNQLQALNNPSYTGFQTQAGVSVGWSIGNLLSNPVSVTNNAYTQSNGFLNGGLKQISGQSTSINPSFSLLGKYAVANATGDYWFVDNTTATTGGAARAGFTLYGLDPNLQYSFTMFGSRSGTLARYTRYVLIGNNVGDAILQTTGTDIGASNATGLGGDTGLYNGNDNKTATVSNITPLSDGTISLLFYSRSDANFSANYSTDVGNTFGYLNLMEVSYIPEPATSNLMIAFLIFYSILGRRK